MRNVILQGDCLTKLRELPDESVDCVVTSPPYWALRDYGVEGQLGLEPTFQEYITRLCDIFDEVMRVLKKEGTCWVNLGDTYGGTMPKTKDDYGQNSKTTKGYRMAWKGTNGIGYDKCLLQIPSRFALEMTNRGWILRNEIIWHKPNCMPSSVKDRFTVDFEKVFFFVKSKKYWFETQYEPMDMKVPTGVFKKETQHKYKGKFMSETSGVINPQGRNKRAVWKIATKPFKEAHFATYPEALIEPMIRAGCPVGGVVLDPFFGAGTTGVVAKKLGRHFLGIELNPEYIKIAEKRLGSVPISLFTQTICQ